MDPSSDPIGTIAPNQGQEHCAGCEGCRLLSSSAGLGTLSSVMGTLEYGSDCMYCYTYPAPLSTNQYFEVSEKQATISSGAYSKYSDTHPGTSEYPCLTTLIKHPFLRNTYVRDNPGAIESRPRSLTHCCFSECPSDFLEYYLTSKIHVRKRPASR